MIKFAQCEHNLFNGRGLVYYIGNTMLLCDPVSKYVELD